MLTCVIAADESLMVISKLSQTRLIEHPAFLGHKMLTLPSLYILEIITYVRSCIDYFEIFIDSHNYNTGQNNLFGYLLHMYNLCLFSFCFLLLQSLCDESRSFQMSHVNCCNVNV